MKPVAVHMKPYAVNQSMTTEQNLPENALSALPACCDFPQKLVLKGSFHQADARFGASRNSGAISLTAVMKNLLTWTAQDLDNVLVGGTRLYASLRKQGNISDRKVKGRNYIAVHELPRRHVLVILHFPLSTLSLLLVLLMSMMKP